MVSEPTLSFGRPSCSQANDALLKTSANTFEAVGAGSYAFTATPKRRKRAAHPLPMTPQPMTAANAGKASDMLGQLELRAGLIRTHDCVVHAFSDRDGAGNETGV